MGADMNKQLDEALTKVNALSDEQQDEVAELLLEYVEANAAGVWLTTAQVAEIERRLADDAPYATEEEVREVLGRLTQ